jgi:hypothetical protein
MFVTDNTTHITGIGLMMALVMCVLMLTLPRRHAVFPFIAMVCWMTMGQRLLIMDLNFTMTRVLLTCALVRVIWREELKISPLSSLDFAMVLWVLSSIVTYTLLLGTTSALTNRLGLAFDALGVYCVVKSLVRDEDDLRTVIRSMAWVIVPVAASMLLERQILRNPFAELGGVPTETIVREGVPRCQGPFSHPILAGAFGSAVLPLFIGLWSKPSGDRLSAVVGAISAGAITFTAASSGPLLAAAIGVLASGMFLVRQHMRVIRWSIFAVLLVLHVVMSSPVWFLLARVGVFGGSTGYHRAILIDHAVNNFSDWWLVGTESTANWGYYMFDITNQYVLIGVNGGIVTLILFVAIISIGFAHVGRAVGAEGVAPKPGAQRLLWALGASLMVHVTNYISVPYFDQNVVNWYMLLGMIAMAGTLASHTAGEAPESAAENTLQQSSYADDALTHAPAARGEAWSNGH